jgi:hypothetical protein
MKAILASMLLLGACSPPSALFGVNVDLTSYQPTYSGVVVVGRAGLNCPHSTTKIIAGDPMRDEGVDFVRMSAPLAPSGTMTFPIESFDAATKNDSTITASIAISTADVQNLPTRSDAVAGTVFSDVSGTIGGTINSGAGWLHNLHFAAQHCPALDTVIGQ